MDKKTIPFVKAFLLPLALLGVFNCQAQEPVFSKGKEFWVTYMQNIYGATTREVIISAEQATTGIVEAPQAGWSQTFSVPANGMTTVLVPVSLENNGSEIVTNKGVHILANDTINVFAHSTQMFSLDATSLLPIANLGDDYIVGAERGLDGFQSFFRSEFAIVATEDNTEIEIIPSDTTANGRPPNLPYIITMNRGESYQVTAKHTSADLTGTIIRSGPNNGECRPFAVFGGSACATVPYNPCAACDHIFQQMAPTNSWGRKYFSFNPESLVEYRLRVIAKDNATQVTIDAIPVATLNAGQRLDTLLSNAHCIEANNPVAVYQTFTGYVCNAGSGGDPSTVLLNSEDQLIDESTFFSGGSSQLNGNWVTLISPMATAGSVSVDGNNLGIGNFTPFPTYPSFGQAHLSVGTGQHNVSAPHGVIAYAYGVGTGMSYLYSLGSNKESAAPMSDTTFCQAGSVDLIAPPEFIDPYWTTLSAPNTVLSTGQTYSVNIVQSEIYLAHGTLYKSGCAAQQEYLVELNDPSPLNMVATPPLLCNNGQSQLDANISNPPMNMKVNWSPGALLNDSTIENPIATISESTWFYVSVESGTGCSRSIDSVLVEVSYPKIISLDVTTSDDTLCAGDQTQLSGLVEQEIAGDGFSVMSTSLWNSIQGGIPSDACGSVAGKALYFDGSGARTAQTNALDVSNGGHIRFMLKVGAGISPCQDADPGEDIVVQYSTNNGLAWNAWAGSTLDESNYPVFTLVDLPIPNTAFGSNTMFRITQPVHSGAGHDNWAIDNISISAFSSSNLNVQWASTSVANPNAVNTPATPNSSEWLVLNVTNPSSGCSMSDSVFVSVGPTFSLNISNDTALCDQAPVQLSAIPSAGAGHSYSWGPNNGTLSSTSIPNPVANTGTTQTYNVTAISDHGCTDNEQVTITVDDIQSISISANDSALCAGETVQLSSSIQGSSTGVSYAWGPIGIMSTPAASSTVGSPSNSTNVTLTVTDIATGCTYDDALPIDVVNLNLDLGADTVICDASNLQLFASHTAPNPSFTWDGGPDLNSNSIQDPLVLLNESRVYTVVLNDAAGCTTSDQIAVTVPFDNLVPLNDTSFCIGDSAFLDASHPNSTVVWNGSTNSNGVWANATSTQNVMLTDNTAGCQTSYSLNVTAFAAPLVDIGNDTTICAGQSITLDAGNPGSTYLWNLNTQNQTSQAFAAGTYWVDVTNTNGCVSRDSLELLVEQIPVVSLNDTTLCVGGTVSLDATWPNATYNWNTSATSPSINVSTSGTYDVTVTTPAGCQASENAVVTFVPFPMVYLGADTALCDNQQLMLDAGNPGLDISWSNNSSAQTISVSSAGIYWVDVANGGCTSRDSIAVTFNPIPSDVLVDQNGCEGDAFVLDAGNSGSTFQWNTNDVSQSLAVATTGTYTVTITNGFNCSATYDAVVNLESPPVFDLGNDTTLCEGEELVLSTGYPNADNDWSNGWVSESITISTADEYSVLVTTQYCSATDTIVVNFKESPEPVTPNEYRACLEESPGFVLIDAGNSGSDYSWSTGEDTQVIIANQYGWYYVDVTNSNECVRSDSVEVIEYCPSSIFIPNSFTPNGDGINDIFKPVGHNIVELEMYIFDRWGKQLFFTNNPEMGWDGTYNGEQVKDEVYTWRIVYTLVNEKDFSERGVRKEAVGHVTVLH